MQQGLPMRERPLAACRGAGHLPDVNAPRVTFLVSALLVGCPSPPSRVTPDRVLFIGNSYTYVNDLPGLFAGLARKGGHPVVVDMVAPSGWTLAEHASSPETAARIRGTTWSFVVLQEQSLVPALAPARIAGMYPAVRRLTRSIRSLGAEPVLLLTWGTRAGMADQGFADYPSMQAALTEGYLTIAAELDLRVAAVGEAWEAAMAQDPALPLWDSDGEHPALAGSYLAACVLYATLFHQSPEGLPGPRELPRGAARQVQAVAARTVLSAAARWHLH
jgi:hypothetical protein